ncbi:TorF family putative porin [Aquabacter sp. CN5-332]|uniref:TorF family putative porin n=1 Tax=Aquabacter sp. CN5-332 TaxID=3156608 RepID=UPI0032B61FA4
MKKLVVAAAASMMIAGAAHAADMSMPVKAVVAPPPPPLFDIAFGVTGTSDYLFRGISQTNNNPAIQGFVELQAFDWLYLNVWASNQNWVENFLWDGNSSLEVDFSGGLRHTWGAFTLDVGAIYYMYPGSSSSLDPVTLTMTGPGSTDYNYWEIYAKPSYVVAPWLTVGLGLNWTSDFAATGTDGTALSLNAKVPLPAFGPSGDFGWFLSGEYGHQWLSSSAYNYDVTNIFTGITTNTTIPGYNWWNVGVAFTYKVATLDLRYSGTDLSGDDCAFIIGNNSACGDKFVATLSFATSLNAFK